MLQGRRLKSNRAEVTEFSNLHLQGHCDTKYTAFLALDPEHQMAASSQLWPHLAEDKGSARARAGLHPFYSCSGCRTGRQVRGGQAAGLRFHGGGQQWPPGFDSHCRA